MAFSTTAKSPLAVGNVRSSTRPTARWLAVRATKAGAEKASSAIARVRNTSLAS